MPFDVLGCTRATLLSTKRTGGSLWMVGLLHGGPVVLSFLTFSFMELSVRFHDRIMWELRSVVFTHCRERISDSRTGNLYK